MPDKVIINRKDLGLVGAYSQFDIENELNMCNNNLSQPDLFSIDDLELFEERKKLLLTFIQ